jgi:hypothetical protein
MNINDFLNSHDLISISSIERKLGITKGTLRKDKDIPERLVQPITELLSQYGYGLVAICDTKPIDVVAKCETVGITCEVTKNTAQFKFKSMAGNIKLFDRVELPIGTQYTVNVIG